MASVILNIADRAYELAVPDAQSAHVVQLGQELDRRVRGLKAQVGEASDAKLMLMLCLVMADELTEANAGRLQAEQQARAGTDDSLMLDEGLASTIETLASRIDGIAERLEKA